MYLPTLDESIPMSVDTETSGLFVDGDPGKAPPARVSIVSAAWRDPLSNRLQSQVWAFDQGWLEGKPGRCAWSSRNRPGWYQLGPRPGVGDYDDGSWNLPIEYLGKLLDWLRLHPLIMHHAKFDCHICAAGHRLDPSQGRYLANSVVWDTQLANGLMWPLESSSLKPTAQRLWGEREGDELDRIKNELRRQGKGLTWRYDLLRWATIGPYAAKDAEQTLRLWEYQQGAIAEGAVQPRFAELMRQEMDMFRTLLDMERRGIGFDKTGCYAQHDRLLTLIDEAADKLPFKATDPAARKYFDVPSIAQAVVRDIIEDPDNPDHIRDAARAWQEWKHLQSAASKWYRAWPAATGPDGRLRVNYRQGRIESDRPGGKTGGAISGRLSAERVQLQAIPHNQRIHDSVTPVRSFFRPADGFDLWELDISQAEVRCAASLAKCSGMRDVLLDPLADVHGATASRVFGVKPGDHNWDDMRAVSKRLTFGILYGAGIRTLRAQIKLFTGLDYSEKDTRALRDQYGDAFPELDRAQYQAQQRADIHLGGPGFVTIRVSGRRRWFGYGERTHKAWNAVIQGTVAEMMKKWMIEVAEDFSGCRMLLQIHDSLVFEVPIGHEALLDDITERGERMFTKMLVEAGGLEVPFKIDRKRWADAK